MSWLEWGNFNETPELPQVDTRNTTLEWLQIPWVEQEVTLPAEGESLGEHSDLRQEVQTILRDRFTRLAERYNVAGYDVFETYMLAASPEIQQQLVSMWRMEARNFRDAVQELGRFPVNDFEFRQSIALGASMTEEVVEATADIEENEIAEAEETITQGENEAAVAAIEESREVGEEQLEEDKNTIERQIEDWEGQKSRLESFNELTRWIRNNDPELNALLNDLSSLDYPDISNIDSLSIEEMRELSDNVGEVYERISNIYTRIVAVLSQPNYLQRNILPQAQAAGNFDAVSAALIALNPSFRGPIAEFWVVLPEESLADLPLAQQSRTRAALWVETTQGVEDDAEQSGNIFTITNEDGQEISYNVVTGERTLSVDGYTLPSQVEDQGDYDTPLLEYMEVEQSTLPQIRIIQEIGQTLTDRQVTTDELAEIRATISSIPWSDTLGIDFYSLDGEEIQTRLSELLETNQTELREAREAYEAELERLEWAYLNAVRKQDEKVQRTLNFLREVGFTLLPQTLTDQLVEKLNSDSWLARRFGFDEQIDFANGDIGMDSNGGESDEIDNRDKVDFARFMNHALGREFVNVSAIENGSWNAIADRNEARTWVLDSGLMNEWAFGRLLSNLNQSMTPTTEEE